MRDQRILSVQGQDGLSGRLATWSALAGAVAFGKLLVACGRIKRLTNGGNTPVPVSHQSACRGRIDIEIHDTASQAILPDFHTAFPAQKIGSTKPCQKPVLVNAKKGGWC